MGSKARTIIILLFALLAGGTAGFMTIENWSFLDSLYMTVITLSTVGFKEVQPLSAPGRFFTVVLIFFGVGSLAYTARWMIESFVELRLIHWRRVQMEIKRIKRHVVVCGYGRMGEAICAHLLERKVPLLVLERDASVSERLTQLGILHLVGDATDDALLVEAGVQRAKALAAVLPHDADNLFVTLTARNQSKNLTIVTRASNEKNEPKMISAGANRVLNPYRTGGQQMARQLLQPAVTEFFDVLTGGQDTGLDLEEIELQSGSSLVGVSLRESPI